MKIHLIGIGGIGVSALAQYYLSKGNEVSGSDLVDSEITEFLKEKGAIFSVPEKPDLVVYSPAVKKDNPELQKFLDLKIKCQSYPEALGELTKEYYTIAVAGAHGKSTTTAMLGLVLAKAGLDPTVIVGTKVKEFGNSNYRNSAKPYTLNPKPYLVIEACEYDSSFLHYYPKIIVITNIDKEHLDYFKTFSNVKKAFKSFIMRLPAGGFLVFNGDDKNLSVIARSFATKQSRVKTQNTGLPRSLRFARNDEVAQKIKKILKVPGDHNVSNALAVFEVGKLLQIPEKIVFETLSEFRGTWRRFEIVKDGKTTIISDYAHHPNEISATLKAARSKYPKKKIWCVFQPHQRQRTFYLFDDFVKVFRQFSGKEKIDKIIITDIYDVAGRETKKINAEISSEKLVSKIKNKNVIYCPAEDIEKFVKEKMPSGVLIIMGAGDIYKLADKF